MTFAWPDGMQNKTKRTISQILWTLHLDFDGVVKDDKDAPLVLMEAMEAHGVEIKNVLWFRMMLPYMDGGKYGRLITRLVIQRRTKEVRLAVANLPEESHLPDGAGGIPTDDRIDMQLFGDTAWTPARGTARDIENLLPARGEARDVAPGLIPTPARGNARDVAPPAAKISARGDARDTPSVPQARDATTAPARGETRDNSLLIAGIRDDEELPARGTRDDEANTPAEPAGGSDEPLAWEAAHDELADALVARLDSEMNELMAPLPAIGEELSPHEVLDLVLGLMAELEGAVRTRADSSVAAAGRSEEDWTAVLAEKHELLERAGRLMRRVKDAESRLQERNREIEGAQTQLNILNAKYQQLEANNAALLRGEPAAGRHLRAAERFITETPSDRPDHGRSRPNRPNGRTTGSDSKLAYTVG